jgi:aminoglycoside phosphotransferase (APT) family kinase protein
MTMHDDEIAIDAELVHRLIADQFPEIAHMTLREVRWTGTVNAVFRVGDHLTARVPRVPKWSGDLEKELVWLPALAPQLTLPVPRPGAHRLCLELLPHDLGGVRVDQRLALLGCRHHR